MSIHTEIQYTSLEDLFLDPRNPRLGRRSTRVQLPQSEILELMEAWTLDELATSFIESGYWPQEALLVVREELYGEVRNVVIEGNRRLAALKLLYDAKSGAKVSRKWQELATANTNMIDPGRIPYIIADTRSDVQAYLGFRHVTGIKEWNPAEKAEFIAALIDDQGFTYEEVRRKIGSKAPTVRQNYIAYRILLQMEELPNDIALENVEERFSVLYLSLRTSGVRSYLQIDIQADPIQAKTPVPQDKLDNLANFALWLFGNGKKPPLFSDSRQVDDFGAVLSSPQAVEYLETAKSPVFETAQRMTGTGEETVIILVERAAYDIQQVLGVAHRYTDSQPLRDAVRGFGKDAIQLLKVFPGTYDDSAGGII